MSRVRPDRRPVGTKHLEAGVHGHGGPAPGGAAVPANPLGPGSPAAGAASNALAGLSDALTRAFQTVTGEALGAGQVFAGLALLVVGLLLATGQGGKLARGARKAGLFAITRGVIR